MDLSDQGLGLLYGREDKRNAVYLDSQGRPTVGVGHCGPEVHMGDVWTDEQVQEAFQKDAAWVNGLLASVSGPLTQNAYDSCFSFIWNIGAGAWASSTILREINAGLPAEQIAPQFDRWHIPAEITTRRNAEKFQFLGTIFAARCDAEGNALP